MPDPADVHTESGVPAIRVLLIARHKPTGPGSDPISPGPPAGCGRMLWCRAGERTSISCGHRGGGGPQWSASWSVRMRIGGAGAGGDQNRATDVVNAPQTTAAERWPGGCLRSGGRRAGTGEEEGAPPARAGSCAGWSTPSTGKNGERPFKRNLALYAVCRWRSSATGSPGRCSWTAR